MPKTFRIRTTPGKDQNLHLNIEQDFDQLEILSLKLTQDDVYTNMCADYGVIVGRVSANGGFGVPNAKVSVFIPLDDIDENNPILSEKYPFKSIEDLTNENLRYNLLPREKQHCGHTPVGSFPSIEEVLVNDQELDVYKKYYKFTVKTNDSGDYMIWGAPLGVYNLHMDIDLSDMGCYSLTPMDFILQGIPVEEFESETQFASNENLEKLPQIVKQRKAVEIVPFWGDDELCSIGITRVDFDLRESGIEITPHAVFMGSSFTDAGSDAVTKRCRPRLKQGYLCNLKTVPGRVEGVRFTNKNDDNNDPVLENWYPPSTEQPGKGGAFLTHLPMNLDYVSTDEFGNQVISQDPSEGVATSGKYRFRISPTNENGSGRQRLVGSYLVPNIRQMGSSDLSESNYWDEPSYAFSVNWKDYEYPNINGSYLGVATTAPTNGNYTAIKDMALACEDYFYHFKASRVYTVSSFIDKIKKTSHRRGFLGIKNIEPQEDASCGGTANYFPITSAYKVLSFMIVIMQIITRMQQIIYQIFLTVLGVLIAPFEAIAGWQIFKGTPFKQFFGGIACALKAAGRIELEAVAYPTCEKCACDEEDQETAVPSTTITKQYGVLDGSFLATNPNDPGPICDVKWWYGGQAGTFYITAMQCKSELISTSAPPGDNYGGIFETLPRVEDISQTNGATAFEVPSSAKLGFRITSVTHGSGNEVPSNNNTYTGLPDFPNWCNSGNGPCADPPDSWSAEITYAGLGSGVQPADPLSDPSIAGVEACNNTALEDLFIAMGGVGACASTINGINTCGSFMKLAPGGTLQQPPDGMCDSAGYGLGEFTYAGDGILGPYAGSSRLFEDAGLPPYTYAFGTAGGNDGGNAGPGNLSICDSAVAGYPLPFYITTNQVTAPVNTFIEDGMGVDTAGTGQIAPHGGGLYFTINTAGSAGATIEANNSDDCDLYSDHYPELLANGGPCDCTEGNQGGCETICGVECENGQCSPGTDGNGCDNGCFGDPGFCEDVGDGCLTTYVDGGCYVIYAGSSISKNNRLISEWRNVTNINTALCNGLLGFYFTNQWINGTLYHFQFKGKERGGFWSGPGCRATWSGVVKYQEREGVSAVGKWGSGANRKRWYYRSTLFDVATIGTTNDGFMYKGSILGTSPSKGQNENYIKFPTTVTDLGPRVSWLKTICANPDLDSECFTAGDIGASSHQQAASVVQAATNQRIAEACGAGDFGGIFFNRDKYRVDGDIAQLLTEQCTLGIQEFDLFDPDYGPDETSVITNLGTNGPPTKMSFILEDSGANSRSCLKTPYDLYDWDVLQNKWVPQNLGKHTQIVPFYPWNRWAGGCGWDVYTLQWGGCGPQNNGQQWNQGVGQDWHTADDNNTYLYSDFYQGLGNNYSGNLSNFSPGAGAGLNNAGLQTFNQNSPNPSFFTGNTQYPDTTKLVLGAPYHFYMGLTPGDNAFSYFLQKYINQVDDNCNADDFI